MTLVEVEINRDIRTSFGTIAAGEKRFAAPSGDGRWLLALWLPQAGRRGRAILASPEWVVRGRQKLRTAERRYAAHEEFEYARRTLGYGEEHAVLWLEESFGVSLKTLREWGFPTHRLEAERRRERAAS